MREGGPVVRPLIGRPSSYTPDVAEEICARLIEGESLRKICTDSRMPGLRTIFQWLEKNDEFAQQYARAREVQQHVMADDTRDIVDTEEDPAKARVRFDQRRWQAGKLLPKVYGERNTTEHTGPNGGPITNLTITATDPVEASKVYQQMMSEK